MKYKFLLTLSFIGLYFFLCSGEKRIITKNTNDCTHAIISRYSTLAVVKNQNNPVYVEILPDSISLRKFCPDKENQLGVTCYAYAPTYTARTILYCIKNNITNQKKVNKNAFSPGFVATRVREEYNRRIGKLWDVNCGRYHNVDEAINVLLEDGCPKLNSWCNCCELKLPQYIIDSARHYKITDTATVTDHNMDIEQQLYNIKSSLSKKQPVVAAIYQTDAFGGMRGDYICKLDEAINGYTPANHVVTIIGYNDNINGGSFLIKNNWKFWGEDGFSWVKYRYFIKLIDESITFQD